MPEGLTANVVSAGVELKWYSSTDDVGVAGYAIYRDGSLIAIDPGTFDGVAGDPTRSFVDEDLPTGLHVYTIYAQDKGGTRSLSSLPASVSYPDRVPPTAPTALQVSAGESGINLSWSASADDVGVAHYVITRDGSWIGSVSELSFTDTSAGTRAHRYTVYAEDDAGNKGPAASITYSDNEPPSQPENVTGENTPGGVALMWSPSTDNVGVVRYLLFRNGSEVGSAVAEEYVDRPPEPGTYAYTVYAEDAEGNQSDASAPLVVIVPPQVLSAVQNPPQGIHTFEPAIGKAPTIALRRQHRRNRLILSVSASDDVAVSQLEIWIDGHLARETQGSSLKLSLINACARHREHRTVIRAFDGDGNETIKSIRVIVPAGRRSDKNARLSPPCGSHLRDLLVPRSLSGGYSGLSS